MDLKDQLKDLFPEHENADDKGGSEENQEGLWIQDAPLLCKFEKRKGKPTTIIDGYTGTSEDFKQLAKELKTKLSAGGTVKKEKIIIQGDFRPQIMKILQERGFSVKRVGG